ncbi:MAG TPA: hypothetical protein VI233_08345, partial [Puia sp.]
KKFYQIENGLDAGELNSNEAFVKEEGAADNGVSFYRVKKEIVMGELFLRPGDEIKIESIDSALLASAARLSQRAVNTDTFRVALFELSTKEIKRFSDESLAHIYHSYQ